LAGSNQQSVTYDDRTAAYFLSATFFWGIIGMLVGVFAALQLAFWPANTEVPYFSFGRIRPIHTNAMVFAFAGNAFFAGLYYSLQRLCKTRMWSDALSKIHFWGWQTIIALAALTLALGYTQGKEYAEMEWPIDILIALVWVLMAVNVFATLAIRKVKHLYVAIWFFIASILTVAMLHVVNGLVLPVSFMKSYSVYAGVQDALVQWWYGHNAVGFLLTTPFLGLMYYFVPKVMNKPIYSYRLSILHFWSLIFIYIWAGPHHLLYTALPEWAQSLGMVFSLMLIAPSWGGMINGLLTMREGWHRVREEPILKFFVLALTFYGMATLEGPLMSIKTVNLYTHYTEWTIAHVHGAALGWLGGFIFAMAYYMVPRLWGKPLYSQSLANTHFWITTVGILLYISSMYAAGVTQALMWFATNDDGLLKYPQFLESVLALKPLYWTRLVGGTLFLFGTILCAYNLYKTAQSGKLQDETAKIINERHGEPNTLHEKMEGHAMALSVFALLAVVIGGIVEFIPTFLMEIKAPTLTSVRPYTPLELQGRDIYVREGCHNCHSQQIRTYHKEELRYGPASQAYEFIYDRPFQWGSKRTGPDLQRLGGKYPDLWHYKHMLDPRSTSPGSIMPSYPWLYDSLVNSAELGPKLNAMKGLGVPYEETVLKDPVAAYLKQANGIRDNLAKDSINVDPQSEIVAMIAYLQKLGKDYQKVEQKEASR